MLALLYWPDTTDRCLEIYKHNFYTKCIKEVKLVTGIGEGDGSGIPCKRLAAQVNSILQAADL